MELKQTKYGNTIVVYLNGRFDIHHTNETEKALNRLLSTEKTSHLIFNLHDVEYISSAGLRLFISIMNKYNERRKKFVLCNLNGTVKKILKVVELNTLFLIFNTENEALEYIAKDDSTPEMQKKM